MIYILAHLYSNRISYVVEQLAQANWQTPCRLVFRESEWEAYLGPKLAYLPSKQLQAFSEKYPNTICIPADTCMFDNTLKEIEFETIRWKSIQVPFGISNQLPNVLPFDAFATIWYLLSRHEEYLSKEVDRFGRMLSKATFIAKTKQEHTPIVDILADAIYKMLQQAFQLVDLKPQYLGLPTYDIDIAYAFSGRNLVNTTAAFAKSLLKFDFEEAKLRVKTATGKQDPFDSFDYIQQSNSGRRPLMFFLERRQGKWDRSIPPKSKAMQQLVANQAKSFEIGLHPSMSSHTSFEELQSEHALLSSYSSNVIVSSRQHFIKIKFPTTYRNLIQLGVKRDYSIGFTDRLGFKAGTAHPFLFFDIEQDSVSHVLLHPFIAMDTTYITHLKWQPEQTLEHITSIVKGVKSRGGIACVIFHNSLLTEWKGLSKWKSVHESILHELA